MKLLNGKLSYKDSSDAWHDLTLLSCDMYFSHAPSRDTWTREGFYSNEVLDNIEINFVQGINGLEAGVQADWGKEWDKLQLGNEGKNLISLRLSDGSTTYEGTFYIGQKYNKKVGNEIHSYERIMCDTLVGINKSSNATGPSSGITEARAIELDNVAKAAAISTSEAYTDTKTAECVKSATSVTSGQKVYVRESGTDKTINYGSGVDLGSGTIVLRATNAQIKVPDTPTADGDAASKKYVDGQIVAGGTSTLSDAKAYTDTVALTKITKTGDKVFKVGVDSTGLYFEEE